MEKLFAALVLAALACACAHSPTEPKAGLLRARIKPRDLLAQACEPGQGVKQVQGVAWMKAKSADTSGQFPASIRAVAPSDLTLEVDHPLGGVAGILTVHGAVYRVEIPGKQGQGRQGRDSWEGIPLRWATELFLGKIPCPTNPSKLTIDDDDELLADASDDGAVGQAEKFIYRFDESHGKYRAKSLHWESGAAAVDFDFEDPDPQTLSPLRWVARSNGSEVKIHWRDREIGR